MSDLDRAINTYIDNKYMVGALLISGKWGAGKTWTIKRIKNEYSRPSMWKFWNWRKFRLISLFGIDKISQFKDSLRSQYSPIWHSFSKFIGFIGIAAMIGFVPNIGMLIGKWSNISCNETPYYELYGLMGSVIASFVSLLFLIGFYILFNRNITKRKFIKKNVFVLDDMERCGLPIKTLLGLVNDLVENGIKVILIANEDNIPELQREQYQEFKEKVVVSTLYHSANSGAHDAFDEFCKRCKNEYKYFLIKNKENIIDSFYENAEENIRAFINALSMFEKAFVILMRKSFKYKERILMSFLRIYYLVSQGYIVTELYDSLPYSGLLARHKKSDNNISSEDSTKKKLENTIESICSDKYYIQTLARWVEMGNLDAKEFEIELEKIEKEQTDTNPISDVEKLLTGWSLEAFPDEILLNTYNEALNIAYDGKTDFNGYIYLMNTDVRLSLLGIKHTLIDWNKIETGLLKYCDLIKEIGTIEEPSTLRHTFISAEDLNEYYSEDAKRIYEIIEGYNPAAESNRKKLLVALKSKDLYEISSIMQRKIFNTIDNEICDAFLTAYQKTKLPEEKRTLFRAWCAMASSIHAYGKLSLDNYNAINKLKNGIDNIQTTPNSISQRINENFVNYLNEFISTGKALLNELDA